MTRPKTYNRTYDASTESRRAVGKFYDENDCKIKTARFSLGTGEEAKRKLAAIQYLYDNGGSSSNGTWLPGLLKIAKQIAAGEKPTFWEGGKEINPAEYARQVYGSQSLIPALKTIDPDPHLMAEGIEANRRYIDEQIQSLKQELEKTYALQVSGITPPDNLKTTIKISLAIEEYKQERTKNYRGKYQGSIRAGKQIDEIAALLPDKSIYTFGLDDVTQVVNHYASRPKTKISEVASKSYCENQIGEFYKFCRWLEAKYDWQSPKLHQIDRRVLNHSTDTLNNAIIDDRHWTPAELKLVFAHADELTILIIALGLNTGSGAAELGRMRVDNFILDKPHPYANLIDCNLVGSWFVGTRQKQFTHSEAYLWEWVATLVKKQIEICKRNGWVYLFSEHGEPLYRDDDMYREVGLTPPKTEKPEIRFVGRYNNALHAAEKHGLERKLSIGKLRKTLPNYLTITKHEDLASLLLSHKTKDDLLGNYANRPYGRLHNAIKEIENHWNLEKM